LTRPAPAGTLRTNLDFRNIVVSISLFQAINHLIQVSRGTVAPVSAPRIVYFAHMQFMGQTEGGLLVDDRFFAMAGGPGSQALQAELNKRGALPLRQPLPAQAYPQFKLRSELIANAVRGEKTAWARTYDRNRVVAISDRAIFEEFLWLHDA
jgi:uncharacterized phage-associated protein